LRPSERLRATALALLLVLGGPSIGPPARGGPVTHALALGALQPATFGAVVALGALAGLVPAVLAYRTEVAENLAPL